MNMKIIQITDLKRIKRSWAYVGTLICRRLRSLVSSRFTRTWWRRGIHDKNERRTLDNRLDRTYNRVSNTGNAPKLDYDIEVLKPSKFLDGSSSDSQKIHLWHWPAYVSDFSDVIHDRSVVHSDTAIRDSRG